jgi:hypothetical protein
MPYEVDPETYDRVAKNFDFERLADCLETVEEIAQRVFSGELLQELRKVRKMADQVLSWDYGHSNVFSDDITLYEDAQELGWEIGRWADQLNDLAAMLNDLGELQPPLDDDWEQHTKIP